MKAKNEYDEKQLLDRGKAYECSFIFALLLNLLCFFISEVLDISISPYSLFRVNFWLPITVCIIIMILKDAYDGVSSKPGKLVLTLFGISGFLSVLLCIIDLITGKESFLSDGILSDFTVEFIKSLCILTIGLTYWIKQYAIRKKFVED